MASLFDRFPGSRSLNGYAGDQPSVNRMAVAQGRGTRPASSGKAEKLHSLSDKTRDPFNKKKKEDLDKKDSVKAKSSAENDSSGKFKSADGKSKPGDGKSKTTEDSKSKSPSESKNSKSGEGKAKADSGYKNRDTLQAQTVQFSSGDGAGGAAMGALSGLMSLLAASQTLASAMNASTNVVAQNATLTLRTNFQTPAPSSGGFASHQIKSGIIGTEAKLEMPLTFKDISFTLSSSQSQSNSSGLSASLGGSKGIFERGNSISVNEEKQSSSPTLVYIGSPTLLSVNSATFFFDSTVQFAFPKGEFSGQVGNYFKSANLPTSSTYSYAIVQADGSTVPAKLDPATGNFLVNEFSISPQGNINTTNVTRPVTELIRITGQDATLDVRVSAGPGSTNMNPPTINPGKVIINNSKGIITGNIYELDINSDFLGGSHPNVLISNTNFTLDGNLIFRHLIGAASSPDAPFDASGIAKSVGTNRSFGNFSNLTINLNDVVQQLPPQPLTYTIKFGGNVLDTYGLSYGDGGTFDLTLPQADVGVNVIMGGNTLSGFGGFVGDLISFILHPTPNIKIDPQVPNAFTFNANSLFVDKAIGTTLYPHLVTLDLRSPEFPHTNQLANNHFNFSDSIMRGNIGNDTFFGDVQNLGTINREALDNLNYARLGPSYTGFLTGVTVTNTDNHVVITDKNSNTITWGNNVYTGGLGKDTYSFTIVGDYQPDKPPVAVMQGNATIRDFNVSQDKLQFVLTPAVFRALDTNVDRILSLDELNAGVTFSSGDLVDPLTKQSAAGTTISFLGGGTLNLGNVSISTFQAITGGVTAGFSGGPDSPGTYSYVATSAIDPASLTQPAIYGSQPATHIYALDAFFNNSDLNLYTVQTSAGMTLPAGIIDVFGSITPTNRDAFLGSVTITATDLSNHTATNTILMGFVDAAETTTVADDAIKGGAKVLLSDIMYGGGRVNPYWG